MGQHVKKVGTLLLILTTLSPFITYFLREFVNVSYSYLLITFLIAAFVFIIYTNKVKLIFPTYLIFYFLFTLYTVFSDLYIASKPFSINYIYSNTFLASALMIFFVENGDYSQKIGERYFKLNVKVLLIAIVVILIQQVVYNKFLVYEKYVREYFYDESFRARLPSIYSYFGSSVDIGFTFLPVLAVVIADKIKNNHKLLSIFFFLTIGAIYSFLTKYRWIMLNYLLIYFLFISYKKFIINKGLTFITGFIVVLFMIYYLALSFNVPVEEFINQRILEKSSGGLAHGSASTRLVAFEVFFKLFPKHPILGKGMLHGFTEGASKDIELLSAIGGRSSQIHVGYLSLLYYYGIIGGFFFIGFLVSLGRKLYKDSKYHGNWGIFIGFLGYVFANLTLVTFKVLYLGMIFILIYNKYFVEQKANDEITEQQDI